jgi:hypothetical protein
MRSGFLLALLSLALALPASAVDWSVQEFELEGATLKVALPAGYQRVGDDFPAMAMTRRGLPPNLRLVAGFFSPEPWRYSLVQQLVPLRDWRFNQADWDQLTASFDQSLKELDPAKISDAFNERADRMTGDVGRDLAVRLEKPVVLPVIDSSNRHVSFPILMALNSTLEGAKRRDVVLAVCMIMVLQDRLVYVYLYEPFTGKETYEILGTRAREAARRTLEANR